MASFPIDSSAEIVGTLGSPGQIELSDGTLTNHVVVRAPVGITGIVDFTLPSTVGTTGQFLQRTGATSTNWATVSGNSNSSLPISITFPYFFGISTSVSSTTFVTLANFVYRGTNIDNIISKFLAIIETNGSNATGQVQVFDSTNGNIIATSSVFGPGLPNPTILDLGTISNLPTTQAIFEVQLRRANISGGGSAEIYTFQAYG